MKTPDVEIIGAQAAILDPLEDGHQSIGYIPAVQSTAWSARTVVGIQHGEFFRIGS
jgi:hypothetical protein